MGKNPIYKKIVEMPKDLISLSENIRKQNVCEIERTSACFKSHIVGTSEKISGGLCFEAV